MKKLPVNIPLKYNESGERMRKKRQERIQKVNRSLTTGMSHRKSEEGCTIVGQIERQVNDRDKRK